MYSTRGGGMPTVSGSRVYGRFTVVPNHEAPTLGEGPNLRETACSVSRLAGALFLYAMCGKERAFLDFIGEGRECARERAGRSRTWADRFCHAPDEHAGVTSEYVGMNLPSVGSSDRTCVTIAFTVPFPKAVLHGTPRFMRG